VAFVTPAARSDAQMCNYQFVWGARDRPRTPCADPQQAVRLAAI